MPLDVEALQRNHEALGQAAATKDPPETILPQMVVLLSKMPELVEELRAAYALAATLTRQERGVH